ncbi:MAG: hypothetical protein ACFE95_00835 [Candidatus Hodarchaeota archaeon]
MAYRSTRENIIAALLNEVPDYVPCCPDISNIIPAKKTRKPFWDIYLHKDPLLGLAQVNAINKIRIDGFSDQGKLNPSFEYNRKFTESIARDKREMGFIDTKSTFKTSYGDITYKTRYYSNQPPALIEKPIKNLHEDRPKLEEFLDPNSIQNFTAEYYSLLFPKTAFFHFLSSFYFIMELIRINPKLKTITIF